MFCKSGFLKSRINRGKILIVSNNNKTKEITIKVLTIFIVIVIQLFQVRFWYRNGSTVSKMHCCCLRLGIQSSYARNYCNCNDLIKYRDGSMTLAISGMTVFVTIVYSYQPLPIVTKSSILDVSRVLNLPLKCSDLIN